MARRLKIIGGGLAGSEAAWRASTLGVDVALYEMKPQKFSPAHKSPNLGELVCSNSFRSDSPENAVGLLKEELRALGSVVMRAAETTKVPAGKALAVDRELFGEELTRLVSERGNIELIRGEVCSVDFQGDDPVLIATGPLSSEPLVKWLLSITGGQNLSFYDALAPIVTWESLERDKVYLGDRYGEGSGDYLNAPFSKEEFEIFYEALVEADKLEPRPFEDEKYFEGCLPIEVMAQRGPKTLTFGPMKPVGLVDPRTGVKPYAVVQLRRENLSGTLWNIVGFQTRLTRPSQEKVFRLIPGLKDVEFARYGAIHRNTYLEAPEALDPFQRLKAEPRLFVGGQISGVEGYVESAAHGLIAGENAARTMLSQPLVQLPQETALGALMSHLLHFPGRKGFAPSNVNFGLFSPLPKDIPRKEHARYRLERARKIFPIFLDQIAYAHPH
ncbi:MAG: methylenetetrahydrofolate--tRNA-(uracil(54)-C(5))-methyltransferase (FADH(2)-oxidizing) TrmFO [Deltaproteobacteria bacterium]|jgi:methylenetetrahydrofolate--tRNA-(uracil-5-)-methyltransferase|nr:methylenetetrahydrofolate--tRNA-(uracil(54)-C(5))-methyltransferase (FADH(2)-oxidizing) TrmFO [Deltaproteobacteria bacterium]